MRADGYYSQRLDGVARSSRNPFFMVYGRTVGFAGVPACRITFFSEREPLTGAECTAVLSSLLEAPDSASLAYAEFTFDVTSIPLSFFRGHLFARSRLYKEIGQQDAPTLYYGSQRSPCQLRVYTKRAGCIRLEIILRRTFLRLHGFDRPYTLTRLRNVDLGTWFSLLSFDQSRSQEIVGPNCRAIHRQMLSRWPSCLTAADMIDMLHQCCSVAPREYLVPCSQAGQIKAMQKRLVW